MSRREVGGGRVKTSSVTVLDENAPMNPKHWDFLTF
jgi:hypothetical protein